jgi:mannose-6-phosphate isomerase-like protein (cupin superfamily)
MPVGESASALGRGVPDPDDPVVAQPLVTLRPDRRGSGGARSPARVQPRPFGGRLTAREESFEVIEGSLDVFKDGEWTTLRPGATATVPPGVPHTLRNGADEPAKIVTRIRPAGRSEAFFRHMHKLIGEGKLKRLPPKEPRSAIYAAMLFNEYPDEIRATGPLNGVFKALALVGKALRFEL